MALFSDHVGAWCWVDGVLYPVAALDTYPNDGGTVVYEVIRCIRSTPLFYEDHLLRLNRSCEASGFPFMADGAVLLRQLLALIRREGKPECNVKIFLRLDTRGGTFGIVMYCSVSHYPNQEDVASGVLAATLPWERQNPTVKLYRDSYQNAVKRAIADKKVYEVLLVNNAGYLLEGSRSNLFCIRKTTLFTAPNHLVLEGVTRRWTIEAANRCGYRVVEEPVALTELETIDGLFLTGTSIKVLPVRGLDGHPFPSANNPVIAGVRAMLDVMIDEYVEAHHRENTDSLGT